MNHIDASLLLPPLRQTDDSTADRRVVDLAVPLVKAMLANLPDPTRPVTALVGLLAPPAAWDPDLRQD